MNEFNYEGWIGSIVGTYSSTSEFPIEGTPNAIYLVVDNGSASAYVWDETGNDYIQMSGGGGGTDTDAVHYRGTVAQASDVPGSPSKGDLYEATAAFVLGNNSVEAGDFIIYDSSSWKVIQGNLNGAVSGPSSAVDGHLAVFDGTSGKQIKDGGAPYEYWEIGKASYKPTASTPCISFQDVKCNGVLFNGSLSTYVTVIKDGITVNMMALSTQSATTFVDGAFDAPLNSSQIDFIETYADTILLRLGTNNGAVLLNAKYVLPLRATAIVDGENGFTSGDQVYDYAEAKANKSTSITAQSTDTEYPSALAVKTYVDQNGFNPSSMETVTETPSLLQAQADWNQSDSTAADYIKNKPTIPAATDIWEIGRVTYYPNPSFPQLYLSYVTKNKVNYSGSLVVTMDGYNGTTIGGSSNLASQVFNDGSKYINLSSTDVTFISNHTSIRIWINDSNYKPLASILIPRKAASIAANENGFVTGDQVNTVVGNIETLLASI